MAASRDRRPRRPSGQKPPPRKPRPKPKPKKQPTPEERARDRARKAGWGGVARKGAGKVPRSQADPGAASEAWRRAMDDARKPQPGAPRARPPAWEPEQWVREDRVRDEATKAVARADKRQRPGPPKPGRKKTDERRPPVELAGATQELVAAVGPQRARRLTQDLREAVRAFQDERFADARRLLRRLAEKAPGAPSVRELYGLSLYRLESYRVAVKELEAFRTLTGSVEQHPVLADTYRALKRYGEVEELWEELKTASPSAELMAEGRIVAAGALADRGDERGAIRLLEEGRLSAKRPKPHHLRLWYALADLHERVGDLPKARQGFERIATHAPGFADVEQRLSALS